MDKLQKLHQENVKKDREWRIAIFLGVISPKTNTRDVPMRIEYSHPYLGMCSPTTTSIIDAKKRFTTILPVRIVTRMSAGDERIFEINDLR